MRYAFPREMREGRVQRKKWTRAKRCGSQLKLLVRAGSAELAEHVEIVEQDLAVALAQSLFEARTTELRREDRWLAECVQQAEERAKARCPLQFDPCLPLRRFEDARNDVSDAVVMRDLQLPQCARDQPWQRAATREYDTEARAV